MLSFYPVDSLSEVMSRERVALVQLGVIVSSVGLVALSCGKIVHHGCRICYDDSTHSWPARKRRAE